MSLRYYEDIVGRYYGRPKLSITTNDVEYFVLSTRTVTEASIRK